MEPDISSHYTNLGICLAESNNYKNAEINYNKSLIINPNDFGTHFQRGELRLQLNKYEASFFDFTKCIEIDPSFLGSYEIRGRIRGELNDYIGAINDFEYILARNPDDGSTIFNLAITYINYGQNEKGKLLLKKAENYGIYQATQILKDLN